MESLLAGLDFNVHVTDHQTRIEVAGEVDMATAPQLAEVLLSAPAGLEIVVDMTDVRFLDAAGLGVLVDAHLALRDRHTRLWVENTTPVVERVFDITGMGFLIR